MLVYNYTDSTTLEEAWGTTANPIHIADTESTRGSVVCTDTELLGNSDQHCGIYINYIVLLNAAKYCPVESNMVVTAVVALGREGVWRLQHVDFNLSDKEVKESIQSAHFFLQPEKES